MGNSGSKDTPLIDAAVRGDNAVALRLLADGAKIDGPGAMGSKALARAALVGNEGTVVMLLNRNAQVDGVDAAGASALMMATYSGHEGIVQRLLQANADAGLTAQKGYTALWYAATFGHLGIANLLLEHKANVNPAAEICQGTRFLPEGSGGSPLLQAARHNHEAVLTVLLQHRADPNYHLDDQSSKCATALTWAAANNRPDMVQLLIDAQADPNLLPSNGGTALMVACVRESTLTPEEGDEMASAAEEEQPDELQRQLRTVCALLESKADPNIVPDAMPNTTPRSSSSSVVASRWHSETALSHACWGNNAPVVSRLLASQAQPTISDSKTGVSPLMKACIKGGSAIVKMLLDAKADPTARSKAGGTVLSALMMQCNDAAEVISTSTILDGGTDPETLQASGHYTLFGETSGFDVMTKRASVGLSHVPGQEQIESVMKMSQVEAKFRLLINANADPNQILIDSTRGGNKKAAHGYSPLLLTATTCNDQMLKLLLDLGADPNFVCKEDGMTPLLVKSCIERYQEGVRILLEHKADPNLKTDIKGMKEANALAIAVAMGIKRNVQYLLDHGANPNSIAHTTGERMVAATGGEAVSVPVLSIASSNHNHDVARLLLQHKADPNMELTVGMCPMAQALSSTRPERLGTVRVLLEHKADPNRPIGGWTPLCCATKQREDAQAVMKVLLQHKADPTITSQATKGKWDNTIESAPKQPVVTPLMLSSRAGLSECVRVLLDAKADPNQPNMTPETEEAAVPLQGCTPLMLASNDTCANLLLSYKADTAVAAKGGVNALMVAAAQDDGGADAVHRLVKAKADPDASAENGCRPLMIAASNGNESVVKALLVSKANPQLQAEDGSRALDYAAERGDASVIALLLAHGAEANARDAQGRTALMRAICEHATEAVRALLDGNADPMARDESGVSALGLAAMEKCDLRVLSMLKAADSAASE